MGFSQWQPRPAACSQGRARQCTKELPPQQQAGEEWASEQRALGPWRSRSGGRDPGEASSAQGSAGP